MKRCLPLTVLLLLALAIPATASARPTFGAEVGTEFILQTRSEVSATTVVSSLKALYKAGGRVGKVDSDWANAEPKAPVHGRHTYNWNYDDMMVTEMAQAKLRLEPSLELAPKWARAHRADVLHLQKGKFVVPLPPGPNEYGNYDAYAKAFMRRYGYRGSFWSAHKSLSYEPVTTVEIWNEPDNTHNWGPQVNLQEYTRMYESVRSAIHSVNSHYRVVTGGLAWTQSSLPRLLKAFQGKPIDAVGFHPYASTPKGSLSLAHFAISELRRYGRGRTPLIANEFGWTSIRDTWGSTKPKLVKGYVYQALVGLGKLPIAQLIPFSWSNTAWGLSDGPFAQAVAKLTHHK
jgi:hypothetical protein